MVVVGATIWLTAWQLQCCGEPFSLGSSVSWQVVPPDEEWLTSVLGPELAQTVTGAEEHHPTSSVPKAWNATGTVRSIRAVCHDVAPRPGEDPRFLYPVPDTTVLTEVRTADGWFKAGDAAFAGYVVDLD
jgi:hypothetical protein